MTDKHYVLIFDWAREWEAGIRVISVAHSERAARADFNNYITEVMGFAKESGYTIYDDSDMSFDSGEDGKWATNHEKLFVQVVD